MLIDRIKANYYENIVNLVRRYPNNDHMLGRAVRNFILTVEKPRIKRHLKR